MIERVKQHYKDNKEKKLDYIKQYYNDNKKKILEYSKEYYQKNKNNVLDYYKKYHSTLYGYCYMIRSSNISEDRKYNRIGEKLPDNYPTIENYIELLQKPDFYDGKQYPFNEMGLDRIDNGKPHTLDNVVPCSTKNNKKRGKHYTHEDFKNFMMIN